MSYIAANRGEISTNNSSQSVLTAAQQFTGTSDIVTDYSAITVFVDTDVNGTLTLQFSIDNVNWDRSKQITIDQSISSGSSNTVEITAKYFRVLYQNGESNQGHFRLQTIYHTSKTNTRSITSNEIISQVYDTNLVRNFNDVLFDISRGLYFDKYSVNKFGSNISSIVSVERDVWDYGSSTKGNVNYSWLESASTVRVKSGGNVNDTAGGTGARTIIVEGLDSNWNLVEEEISLNGSSASNPTSAQFLRVNRVYVNTVGTYTGANTGDILLEATSGGSPILALILATEGHTKMSMYTIPANYTGFIFSIFTHVSTGTNKFATLRLYKRDNDFGVAHMSKQVIHSFLNTQQFTSSYFTSKHIIPQKSDIWFTANANSTTQVDVFYDLIVVKNENLYIAQ